MNTTLAAVSMASVLDKITHGVSKTAYNYGQNTFHLMCMLKITTIILGDWLWEKKTLVASSIISSTTETELWWTKASTAESMLLFLKLLASTTNAVTQLVLEKVDKSAGNLDDSRSMPWRLQDTLLAFQLIYCIANTWLMSDRERANPQKEFVQQEYQNWSTMSYIFSLIIQRADAGGTRSGRSLEH